MKVVIHGINKCKYCRLAKELCEKESLEYESIVYEKSEYLEKIRNILKNEEIKTAPQITVDDKHIGGYNDFSNYMGAKSKNEKCSNGVCELK